MFSLSAPQFAAAKSCRHFLRFDKAAAAAARHCRRCCAAPLILMPPSAIAIEQPDSYAFLAGIWPSRHFRHYAMPASASWPVRQSLLALASRWLVLARSCHVYFHYEMILLRRPAFDTDTPAADSFHTPRHFQSA
jgi:hypothetical protein